MEMIGGIKRAMYVVMISEIKQALGCDVSKQEINWFHISHLLHFCHVVGFNCHKLAHQGYKRKYG